MAFQVIKTADGVGAVEGVFDTEQEAEAHINSLMIHVARHGFIEDAEHGISFRVEEFPSDDADLDADGG